MLQCPTCGEWLSDRATRCLLCGARLGGYAAAAPVAVGRAEQALRDWLAHHRAARLCLMLHYAEELTVPEIAEVLGLGTDYVYETLRCAREEAGLVAGIVAGGE